ncbi:hypothetical protein CHARACLAT_015303 [Characodon lateralis]|uniref:Uncharacterized protein n=1 Tax=Characodon lateralis TaxID=208331 RepID=A0ABU7CP57_9TELE|nr:hypothetical protein [Characodon lateralis]
MYLTASYQCSFVQGLARVKSSIRKKNVASRQQLSQPNCLNLSADELHLSSVDFLRPVAPCGGEKLAAGSDPPWVSSMDKNNDVKRLGSKTYDQADVSIVLNPSLTNLKDIARGKRLSPLCTHYDSSCDHTLVFSLGTTVPQSKNMIVRLIGLATCPGCTPPLARRPLEIDTSTVEPSTFLFFGKSVTIGTTVHPIKQIN